MPAAPPLPGDLLPLNAELTKRLDPMRWSMRTEPLVDELIDHLITDLGEPQEILTSLDRWRPPSARTRTTSASPSPNSWSRGTPTYSAGRSRPTWNAWSRTSASA